LKYNKKNVAAMLCLIALLLMVIVVSLDKKDQLGQVMGEKEKKEVKVEKSENGGCATIQSGELYASDGTLIAPGFDDWGYNYQARLFDGGYCDAYRDAAWCQPYKDVNLIMKWNDAWLSNKDCDGDGLLDRHYGYDSYIGSGAWETNHQWGEYEGEDGKTCRWSYFVKIVAVPADATLTDGVWYTADGTKIGEEIWGAFAIVQQVENDPCAGIHGLQNVSPTSAGFGYYK
jgi:hypothetical protein